MVAPEPSTLSRPGGGGSAVAAPLSTSIIDGRAGGGVDPVGGTRGSGAVEATVWVPESTSMIEPLLCSVVAAAAYSCALVEPTRSKQRSSPAYRAVVFSTMQHRAAAFSSSAILDADRGSGGMRQSSSSAEQDERAARADWLLGVREEGAMRRVCR